jgi:hypothetical protein
VPSFNEGGEARPTRRKGGRVKFNKRIMMAFKKMYTIRKRNLITVVN